MDGGHLNAIQSEACCSTTTPPEEACEATCLSDEWCCSTGSHPKWYRAGALDERTNTSGMSEAEACASAQQADHREGVDASFLLQELQSTHSPDHRAALEAADMPYVRRRLAHVSDLLPSPDYTTMNANVNEVNKLRDRTIAMLGPCAVALLPSHRMNCAMIIRS